MEDKKRSKLWFIIKIGNNFNVMLIVAFFLGVLLIGYHHHLMLKLIF